MNEFFKNVILFVCVYLSGLITGIIAVVFYNKGRIDTDREQLEEAGTTVDSVAEGIGRTETEITDGIGTVQDRLAECEQSTRESLAILEEIRNRKDNN